MKYTCRTVKHHISLKISRHGRNIFRNVKNMSTPTCVTQICLLLCFEEWIFCSLPLLIELSVNVIDSLINLLWMTTP